MSQISIKFLRHLKFKNNLMIIIGIDPGLTKTGVGIIEAQNNSLKFIASETIHSSSSDVISIRLKHFHESIERLVKTYKPHEAAIEETFVNKNPVSSLKLGHARGALILSLGIFDLKVYEYSATAMKKAIVGKGRAEKEQVQAMVKILLKGCDFNSEDEADALAIAICHHNNKRNF